MNCPECRRILQSGYCANCGHIFQATRINRKTGMRKTHGAAFQSAFDKAFGLEPLINTKQSHSVAGSITVGFEPTDEGSNPSGTIHSKQAGTPYIPRHPNMPVTTSTKTMLGDGHFQPSPPPTNIIDSEADLKTFLKMSNPHSLRFGDYSSSIPIIKSCEVLD